MFVNGVGESRPAIRRKAHQLVLAVIHREAAVGRKGRVEQPQRMRKSKFTLQANVIAFSNTPRGGRPFADSVDREDRRFVERAGEESARGMAFMVLQKH